MYHKVIALYQYFASTELPLDMMIAYLEKYPTAETARHNFIADWQGRNFCTLWADLRTKAHFKHYDSPTEQQKVERILTGFFNNGAYHSPHIPKDLQWQPESKERRKIVRISGHPNPDADSLIAGLGKLEQFLQCSDFGQVEFQLVTTGTLPEITLDIIDDLVLGVDRGTRSYIRKLVQRKETYEPLLQESLIPKEQCYAVSKAERLLRVDKLFERTNIGTVIITDTLKYLGSLHKNEINDYLHYLFKNNIYKKASHITVGDFLTWKKKNIPVTPTIKPDDFLFAESTAQAIEHAGTAPVVDHDGIFCGVVTKQELDHPPVYLYMVDTQDWTRLPGVKAPMVRGYTDHHSNATPLPQNKNFIEAVYKEVGAAVTIITESNWAQEAMDWGPTSKLLEMYGIYDDSNGIDITGKASSACQEQFRRLAHDYSKSIADPEKKLLENPSAYMRKYFEVLLHLKRHEKLAAILTAAKAAMLRNENPEDQFMKLILDYKTNTKNEDTNFIQTYWICQLKINEQDSIELNTLDFKDWYVDHFIQTPSLLHTVNANREHIIFFTTADNGFAPLNQYDEILYYTKTPGKMLEVSKLWTNTIRQKDGAPFAPEQIKVYRRLRPDLPGKATYFDPAISQRIKKDYSSHGRLLDSLFFDCPDGGLALKKEVKISEKPGVIPALDIVMDIMLKYKWKKSVTEIQAIHNDPQRYETEYVEQLYNSHFIIIKYPPKSIEGRFLLVDPLTKAIPLIYR